MNIIDIAKLAGVSVATVSRVLNNKGPVRADTRERVLAVVREQRYTPNALARSLIQSRTATIGVLTVDILNPYYATVTHYAEQRLRELGFTTFLCNTGERPSEKRSYIRTLMENRVDGFIFVGSTFRSDHSGDLIDWSADALPTVLINGISDHKNCTSVLCDDESGIRIAVDHLKTDSSSILFVGTIRTASGRRKFRSFRQFSDAHEPDNTRGSEGGAILPRSCLTSDHTLDRLPGRLTRIFGRTPFDAVLASDDLFAHAVLSWAREFGLVVPEDLRVTGYNDSQIARYVIPQLTTIDSRMDALGITAAERIAARVAGSIRENEIITLQPRLKIGRST